MKPAEFWKNFKLGEELSVAGSFIYNGVRRFHELKKLDYPDELFEVFYYLSIGFERLLKIAVVLLEHEESGDQLALEKSMITHSHPELLRRVRKRAKPNLAGPHNDFLALLATFYKSLRYDRFSLSNVSNLAREREALCVFLGKHLKIQIPKASSILGTPNDERYRKLFRKLALKTSKELFLIVRNRASELGLYTYELRHGSKAETVFLGKADIPAEDVLWKELLVWFMNTKEDNGYLRFLRSIPPLDFDPGDISEYLDCFQSDAAKAFALDELDHHYTELEGKKAERLTLINAIAAPGVFFDEDEEDEPT